METSSIEALAGFAFLVSVISFVLGATVLIVFFVMAFNIGTMTSQIKAMRMDINRIYNSVDTTQRKVNAYDAIEAAKKHEHSKI